MMKKRDRRTLVRIINRPTNSDFILKQQRKALKEYRELVKEERDEDST